MKRIVCLTILLFLISLLVGYIFSDTGHFFNIKNPEDQIRIVTWNVSNFGWDNGYSEIRRDRILNTLSEIDADFMDSNEKDDVVTSDRQRVKEDDERYEKLKEYIWDILKKVQREWTILRNQVGAKRALAQPAIQEWYNEFGRKIIEFHYLN